MGDLFHISGAVPGSGGSTTSLDKLKKVQQQGRQWASKVVGSAITRIQKATASLITRVAGWKQAIADIKARHTVSLNKSLPMQWLFGSVFGRKAVAEPLIDAHRQKTTSETFRELMYKMCISMTAVTELRQKIELLPNGPQKTQLLHFVQTLTGCAQSSPNDLNSKEMQEAYAEFTRLSNENLLSNLPLGTEGSITSLAAICSRYSPSKEAFHTGLASINKDIYTIRQTSDPAEKKRLIAAVKEKYKELTLVMEDLTDIEFDIFNSANRVIYDLEMKSS